MTTELGPEVLELGNFIQEGMDMHGISNQIELAANTPTNQHPNFDRDSEQHEIPEQCKGLTNAGEVFTCVNKPDDHTFG